MTAAQTSSGGPPPLAAVLELIRRARDEASNQTTLCFLAVNDSHLIAPYQQAALLWDGQVVALSGVVQPEVNAPYARWLTEVAAAIGSQGPRKVSATDLPSALGPEWEEWLPAHAVWIPCGRPGNGVLFVRDKAWTDMEIGLLAEWLATWTAFYAVRRQASLLQRGRALVCRWPRLARRPWWILAALLLVAFIPVRLSVLAPAELVPARPIVIRAPLDGIIQTFHVRTNDRVATSQPLFSYDVTAWSNRLGTALEALRTAEAEERQYSQLALQDMRARSQLAAARGNRDERHLEVEFLREQLARAQVLSPQDGVVFFQDDPIAWIGRPVSAGQRVLRLADPEHKQIEIWLPVADGIELPYGSEVHLYLNSSPLDPVAGRVHHVAYEAVRRPEGTYAYKVLAALSETSAHRVGLKGTARLSGSRVPLIYWVLRRPLAAFRGFFGI